MAALDAITGMSMGRKIAISAVLMLGIAAVYYFVFYQAKTEELETERQQLQTMEVQSAKARQEYAEYEKLTQQLLEAREEASQLQKKLPTSRDIEGFLTLLNTKAKEAGLRLTNIVPRDEQDSEYYVKIPIFLEFRGTYHQVFRFFALVDREIERPVNMEGLTVSRASTPDEPNMLQGSVLATTFMAKETKNVR